MVSGDGFHPDRGRVGNQVAVPRFSLWEGYDFAATPEGGTNLTFALDAQLSGIRGMLMGGAVQRTMDAEVKTLDNLKRVLEAQAGA